MDVCQNVTVIRHGRVRGTVRLDQGTVDAQLLARMMVDRDVQRERRAVHRATSVHDPVLEVEELTTRRPDGGIALAGVSFSIGRGEILGVAGVSGNGQQELAEAIAGVRPRLSGSVRLAGREVKSGDPVKAIAQGIAYVPEDRMGVGLVPALRITDNILLKVYRSAPYSRGPFLVSRAGEEATRALVDRFDIKGSPRTLVRQLSGGNAQKVLLARELSSHPAVLLISAPTAGLDVAATARARQMLLEAADRGVAVLLLSEDLDEVMDLSDRIAVMYQGRIVGFREAATVDVSDIGRLMAGL
jgi:simple sugar transport system ATP-binding protein